jgi:putative copper resistance protein D
MTEAALTLARAVQYAAAIVLFGQFAFAFAVSPEGRLPRHFGRVAAGCALALAASAIAWLALEASNMSGQPLGAAVEEGTWRIVLARTFFGHAWIARAVFFALLCGALLALRRGETPARRAAAAFAALLLLATISCAGHAAGGIGTDRDAHLVVDGVHLVAAGAWVGTLLPFVALLREAALAPAGDGTARAWRAARRFSTLGIACVGALVLTGVVNACYMVHGWDALVDSRYGAELLAKLSLAAVMVVLAVVNRHWLTPRLARGPDPEAALHAIVRNAALEIALGFAIVLIVANLGITEPPMGPMTH